VLLSVGAGSVLLSVGGQFRIGLGISTSAKAENSFELKGELLSLWNVSGIPWVAKRFFSFPITAVPVFVLCNSSISK